mgnify:FL=1
MASRKGWVTLGWEDSAGRRWTSVQPKSTAFGWFRKCVKTAF